ncbi:hypothetical protein ABZV75_25600 [Streptomyces flaveolus]|uniref:hypothetical protein n=1 Tax=Streptomyces flaveolus TaxID=67297 RepID=UPI0033BCC9A6
MTRAKSLLCSIGAAIAIAAGSVASSAAAEGHAPVAPLDEAMPVAAPFDEGHTPVVTPRDAVRQSRACSGDVVTATAKLTVRQGPGTNYGQSGEKAKGSHFCVIREVRGGTHTACHRTWNHWARLATGGYVTSACLTDLGPGRP